MKIVIATDSFKGSASTFEVADFIEKGIHRVTPTTNILKLPIADGGEGTLEAVVSAKNGRYIEKNVTGPLGEKINAKFGIIDGNKAVIEMAEASGLPLIKDEDRNPFKSTTYGTGELLKAALDYGVKEIFIGIGGSATNDGGIGMAQALGVSFKDKANNEIGYGAEAIKDLQSIDLTNLDERMKDTKVIVFSDVTNPLCGKSGASYIYGPQKGASSEDVEKLDHLLMTYGQLVEDKLGIEIINNPGAGAAGGLGAGLMAFCDAKLHSGIEKILEIIKLEELVKDADLVITGEGKMDLQSIHGKAPIGVAKVAKKFNVPVVAIVGSEGDKINDVYNHGIDLIIDIINKPMNIQEAIENVGELTESAAEKVIRAFLLKEFPKKVKEETI